MEGFINLIYQAIDKAILFNIYINIIYPLWMKYERKLSLMSWDIKKSLSSNI